GFKDEYPMAPATNACPSRDPVDRACRLHDRAVAAREAERLAQAVRPCRRALRLLRSALGPDHPDVANVLNTLGRIRQDQGDYAAAVRLFRRSARIMQALPADGDLARIHVQALSGLATTYRMQGRYAEAEPLHRRALALAVRAFGPDDLDV